MIELPRLIENCPSALLDVSLKALALGLCASLVLAVGRVKSPALRHAVWGNVLCGMLVLPLLSLLLPAIVLPVLPGAPGKARGVADQSSWEKPSSAGAPSVDGHNAVSRVAPYEWEPGAQPNAPPNPVKGAIPAAALRVAWPAVIAGVYVVGVVGLFGRLLFGLVGCRRLVLGGCALDMVHLLSGCSAELGAALRRHRIPVLVCSAVRTPVTLGCLRPRILLPGDWSDWSDSKREAALAHELAHVERRDALFAALAALNQCLYWFHPLAWLLPRRLAWLSEQACDDRAIALTGAAIPYARHLLEFAGAMVGQRRRVTLGVLSMSDGGNLRARIEAVLDRSRALSAPLTRDARLRLLVLALVVVPAIAALRVGPRALGSAGTPTQNDPQARPANGKTVSPPEPTYIEVRSVLLKGLEDAFYELLKRDRVFDNERWPFLIKVRDVQDKVMVDAIFKHKDKDSPGKFDVVVQAKHARLKFDPLAKMVRVYLEDGELQRLRHDADVFLINDRRLDIPIPPDSQFNVDKKKVINSGLKYQDFDRVMAAVTTVTRAVPIREFPWQIRHQGHWIECHVVGTTHDYAAVTGLKMDRGRFLTDADNAEAQTHVVVGSEVARALFPEEDPVGKSVKVGTDYYTVVGVVKQANDLKDNVYMPLMTSRLRFGERIINNRAGTRGAVETQLSRLILEVRDGADVEATAALVKCTLEPHDPKGDVEVVILKPDRKTK